MIDEGYIKFKCEWVNEPLTIKVPEQLIQCRNRMYQLKLIGYYDDMDVGYGNISIKTEKGILISGTQTGDIVSIQPQHFTLVTNYDIPENKVICRGPIKASSESMTHAAVYEADPSIKAIIHVHHMGLWEQLLDKVPTTHKEVTYGTPEMAQEIFRLFATTNVKNKNTIVMAGHEEGIIFFGDGLSAVESVIENTLKRLI